MLKIWIIRLNILDATTYCVLLAHMQSLLEAWRKLADVYHVMHDQPASAFITLSDWVLIDLPFHPGVTFGLIVSGWPFTHSLCSYSDFPLGSTCRYTLISPVSETIQKLSYQTSAVSLSIVTVLVGWVLLVSSLPTHAMDLFCQARHPWLPHLCASLVQSQRWNQHRAV